jgi:hypothetical protein
MSTATWTIACVISGLIGLAWGYLWRELVDYLKKGFNDND